MFDDTKVLLKMGIAAVKAGELEAARSYMNRVLLRDTSLDDRIEAWYWLSEIAKDPEEAAIYLEQILVREPFEPRARRKWAIIRGELRQEEIINPDIVHMVQTEEVQPVDAKRFTCPNCGGKLVYGADGQTLICEYCESVERKKRLASSLRKNITTEEHDFILALATSKGHSVPTKLNTFSCKGCGVEFILPPNQLTVVCPYCASSYVLEKQESRELVAPDQVIPFRIQFQQIVDSLRTWLREDPPDPPVKVFRGNGAYIPVWVFVAGGSVNWSCQMELNNRWLPREGMEPILSSEVFVSATDHIPGGVASILQDYHYDRAVSFEERYLVNLLAETYDVSVSDASLDARKMILDRETDRISHHFELPVRDVKVSLRGLAIESYRLVLVPAWVTFYMSGEDRYDVWVNGQTGAVYGERPSRGIKRILDNIFG